MNAARRGNPARSDRGPVAIVRAALPIALLAACAGARPAPASAFPAPAPLPVAAFAPAAAPERAHVETDTLVFRPAPADSGAIAIEWTDSETVDHDGDFDESLWPQTPFGDDLLSDPDEWRLRGERALGWSTLTGDYNRVDRLRLGFGGQMHPAEPMMPRVGGRLEYSFGRKRMLYGVRFEQPLAPDDWLSMGFSMERRTAHLDLQHIPDWENSLHLLFGRNDHRDYFETEGVGGGIRSRLGDVTSVSVQVRNDEYRSLPAKGGITSLFWRERVLRDNAAIDEGEAHTLGVQLERLRRRKVAPRAGIYHWLSLERAGYGLGGDFEYTRLLGDVRTVVRLSPATTLALRLLGGSTLDGALPAQRAFTLGGVDALRAHNAGTLRGDQVALAQAEYTIGLWQLAPHDWLDGGLHLIAFVDAGSAWSDPSGRWSIGDQRFTVDGGFGIGTDDDDLRIYFARNLHDPSDGFNVTARLQRPF